MFILALILMLSLFQVSLFAAQQPSTVPHENTELLNTIQAIIDECAAANVAPEDLAELIDLQNEIIEHLEERPILYVQKFLHAYHVICLKRIARLAHAG